MPIDGDLERVISHIHDEDKLIRRLAEANNPLAYHAYARDLMLGQNNTSVLNSLGQIKRNALDLKGLSVTDVQGRNSLSVDTGGKVV